MVRHVLLMCVTASFASFVALPGMTLVLVDVHVVCQQTTSMIEEHVRQPPRRARGLVRAHTDGITAKCPSP
jgi:hypothetical protein